jgi:PAS domain-containing protein
MRLLEFVWPTITDPYDAVQVQTTLEVLTNAFTFIFPSFSDSFMASGEELLTRQSVNYILVVLLFGVISVALLLLLCFDPLTRVHADSVLPIMASVPAGALDALTELLTSSRAQSSGTLAMVYSERAFQSLLDAVVFVSEQGRVIALNPSAQRLLEVDAVQTNTVDFGDFMSGMGVDLDALAVELPPPKRVELSFTLAAGGQSRSVRVAVMPTRRVQFQHLPVAFAAVFEDCTRLDRLVEQCNEVSNHLNILLAEFVDGPMLRASMAETPFQPQMLSKLAVSCFVVAGIRDGLSVLAVQDIVRRALNAFPRLVYSGRSMQMFRIIAGLNALDENQTATEYTSELVHCSLQIVRDIGAVETEGSLGTARCGVHIGGPYLADAVSEMPPVFEVFGAAMQAALELAWCGKAGHVVVSRDVYMILYDQGFRTSSEEIASFAGDGPIDVHVIAEPDAEDLEI